MTLRERIAAILREIECHEIDHVDPQPLTDEQVTQVTDRIVQAVSEVIAEVTEPTDYVNERLWA